MARGSSTDVERGGTKNPDWDSEWDLGNMPRGAKWCFGAIGMLIAVMLLVALPMIYDWSTQVGSDHNAVVVHHDGELESEAVAPGRRFHGPGGKVVLFPRFDATIEYSGANPINVRVEDGQIISIDLSFQYETPKDNLVEIYRRHKDGFVHTLQQLARSILRDEAAKYRSTDFFSNRSGISREMRRRMEAEGESRLIRITGFQIRDVVLPDQLINNLFNVQRQRLEINARQELLVLDQINASTNALELRLRTERMRGLAEFDQQTAVLLAQYNQNRSRIEATTAQLLAQIQGLGNETLRLYQEDTAAQVEVIRQNITVETEITRRELNRVQQESETNLTIFYQDTENLKLQYDNNVTAINAQARQNVTHIHSETEQTVQLFDARLQQGRAYTLANRTILLAHVKELAANQSIASRESGLTGLPSAVYLAQTIANNTLDHTRFYDANVSSLISTATT